ncbi:hypothetical protein ASE12_16470 [Aeromicrobium sp. Root236]|uniref:hypothetical protein n=1 Tax=Aeromicrobium sp. Root236 TaxID=1736498 RepID=UPI0006FFB045|nr:hypothetical protein [Aeromicrobium sp. Root236]KRC66209.1 hypothetical protein ASE12_16470 [Aeromicrobium sp. Root236]
MVTIPGQFNGPLHSGNGGYVAGLLGQEVDTDGPATSTLRIPPPLDVPLSWERDGDQVRLLTAGGAVIGDAAPGAFSRDVAPCPSPEEAAAGLAHYPGFAHHPFDHCFTCGTARDEGDGLRLFAGPIDPAQPGLTAAPWTPHEAFDGDDGIDLPVAWAALDCPGGWAADFSRNTMVLGRMTAQVDRRPHAGERCLAVGHLEAQEGRKFLADTALYTEDGELLGRAEQTWILIDIAAFS